jgi:Flp pilus assembly protein TadD
LRQAARLNRLSDQPYGVAGTIAGRLHDWRTARSYFVLALRRNDDNWYSWFEEGIADARTGRRGRALAELRHARRLDPKEPLVSEVLDAVLDGRAFSVEKIDQALVARGHVAASR